MVLLAKGHPSMEVLAWGRALGWAGKEVGLEVII
jgi:hypothetical protein